MKDPLKQLEDIVGILNTGSVSQGEFERVFLDVLAVLGEVKRSLMEKVDSSNADMMVSMDELRGNLDSLQSKMDGMSKEMSTNSKHKEMMEGLAKEVGMLEKKLDDCMSDMSDMKKMCDEMHEEMNEPEEPEEEIKPNELRDKLESIKSESDKLSIEAIGGLREELDRLDKLRQKAVTIFGSNTAGLKNSFKEIDISSQLDGATSTFNLPNCWHVLSVSLSSYPYGALRNGVDFTWTPTSITFTSEIDQATQLAAGQKCILTVVTG